MSSNESRTHQLHEPVRNFGPAHGDLILAILGVVVLTCLCLLIWIICLCRKLAAEGRPKRRYHVVSPRQRIKRPPPSLREHAALRSAPECKKYNVGKEIDVGNHSSSSSSSSSLGAACDRCPRQWQPDALKTSSPDS